MVEKASTNFFSSSLSRRLLGLISETVLTDTEIDPEEETGKDDSSAFDTEDKDGSPIDDETEQDQDLKDPEDAGSDDKEDPDGQDDSGKDDSDYSAGLNAFNLLFNVINH